MDCSVLNLQRFQDTRKLAEFSGQDDSGSIVGLDDVSVFFQLL